ncbi:MAG: fumarate lyase, partial [Comamonas sp.]|nr:fumarate lyase [Comamonas sp.]
TLQVHPQRMLEHVAGLRGMVFSEACVHALAHFTGKHEALAAVEQLAPLALEQQRELQELLVQWAASLTTAELPPEQLPALRRALSLACDPQQAVQASQRECLALLARRAAATLEESPVNAEQAHLCP